MYNRQIPSLHAHSHSLSLLWSLSTPSSPSNNNRITFNLLVRKYNSWAPVYLYPQHLQSSEHAITFVFAPTIPFAKYLLGRRRLRCLRLCVFCNHDIHDHHLLRLLGGERGAKLFCQIRCWRHQTYKNILYREKTESQTVYPKKKNNHITTHAIHGRELKYRRLSSTLCVVDVYRVSGE